TMPAHRQTTAGFNKDNTKIIFSVYWRIKDAATHHIMPSWFKHQRLSNPIIFSYKVLSFFTHTATGQPRTSSCDDPYRISAGMGIYTKKSFSRHGFTKRILFLLFEFA